LWQPGELEYQWRLERYFAVPVCSCHELQLRAFAVMQDGSACVQGQCSFVLCVCSLCCHVHTKALLARNGIEYDPHYQRGT
jgi:hypothetical protein